MRIPTLFRTTLRPAALCACLLVAGCSGGADAPRGGFTPPPTPVETAPVVVRTVSDVFESVGTIEAGESVEVVSEIDAALLRLPFQEGGAVARGQVVALLDDVQPRAELTRAQAVRDQAQASYDRIKRVVDLGAGAPQDLDDAAAALKVAEADVLVAEARLAKTRIRAPFAGMIGARRVSPGAFLRAGQAVTDLTGVEEVRVTFSMPERFLGRLTAGAPVLVSTPAYPDVRLTGTIAFVEPALNPETRSAQVVALVRNPERLFRPGMSANVSAVLAERPTALTIPNESVFVSESQTYVFRVDPDSTVARVPVALGTRMVDVVEIAAGLDSADVVVRAGHHKLFEGAKVFPVQSRTDTTAA